MAEELIVASYPVFVALPERLEEAERDVAAKEAQELIDNAAVELRGAYHLTGLRAGADLMLWLVADSLDVAQEAIASFLRTRLGRALRLTDVLTGIVRPAEFTPDHLPAFVKGAAPKRYVSVYPFVRTPDWYLLDPSERAALLREHGEAGRAFPDVLPNTTSAFGLNDYEWILAFEADSPERIVELIRALRATEARRYTKTEVPFYAGIRKELSAIVAELP
jgi:chlorite dismutase